MRQFCMYLMLASRRNLVVAWILVEPSKISVHKELLDWRNSRGSSFLSVSWRSRPRKAPGNIDIQWCSSSPAYLDVNKKRKADDKSSGSVRKRTTILRNFTDARQFAWKNINPHFFFFFLFFLRRISKETENERIHIFQSEKGAYLSDTIRRSL